MAVWKAFMRAFLAAVGVIVPAFAFAADTGTVSGSVFDQNGEPVAEATVKAAGASLPAGRTVLTGANGTFRFEYLLPGEYEISIENGAARGAVRRAVVEVGKDTQLDFVVGLELKEAVTVTAISPLSTSSQPKSVSTSNRTRSVRCRSSARTAACFSWCRASRTIAFPSGLPREERGRTTRTCSTAQTSRILRTDT